MDRRTAVKNIALSLGLAVSGSTVISLFNACNTDKQSIKLEFFSPLDFKSIEFLVDIILPKTLNKGANELHVPQFIDKMCQHIYDDKKQQNLKIGITEFSKQFEIITGKTISKGIRQDYEKMIRSYFEVSEEKEKAIFIMLAKENDDDLTGSKKTEYALYFFLTTVRELSLLGYFTSQAITEGHWEV